MRRKNINPCYFVLANVVWLLGLVLSSTFQNYYKDMHSNPCAYFFSDIWQFGPLLPIAISLFSIASRHRPKVLFVVLFIVGMMYLASCFLPFVITVGVA